MAGFSSLASFAESLIRILQAGLDETFSEQRVTATLDSPKKIVDDNNTTNRLLSAYLYRMVENADLKNAPPVLSSEHNNKQYQSIAYDLYFLLTPYGQNEDFKLRVLGRTQQILFQNTIFSGSRLLRSLEGEGEQIRISSLPMPQELTTQIWQAMEVPMILSMFYLVTPVRIDMPPISISAPVGETEIIE